MPRPERSCRTFKASVRAFYTPDGSAPQAGDRLVQADLARTLQLIASNGPDAFYKGPIADLIAREMTSSGGLISKEDLAAYAARERAPITGTFRGYHIMSMGPPSSGGIALVELLNILEAYPLADYGPNASRTMHLMIEAERRVYADRAEWLGDPDFVKVPVSGLIAKPYANKLRASISTSTRRRATTCAPASPPPSSRPRRRTTRSWTPTATPSPRRRR